MTRSKAEDETIQRRRPWRAGVSGRLLAAFSGIALFAILAAAAAIHGLGLVGERIAVVGTRMPTTLAALELSRSAERIIAAAPALLAAADRAGRDAVAAGLAEESRRLGETLRDLESGAGPALPLEQIAAAVTALRDTLGDIEAVVGRRLVAAELLAGLRRDLFDTGAEVQRLLGPWLTVLDHEVAVAVGSERPPAFASLRRIQAAQRQISALLDLLAEASTTTDPDRLPILQFQTGLGLRGLDAAAAGLDDRLRPPFVKQVERLRALNSGPRAITEARGQELELAAEGESRLATAALLSGRLTAAVDRLGTAAKDEVARTVDEVAAVQRLSTRILVALVVLSLASSALIVWLYVHGNVVRRLTALSEGMLAIANGRLNRPVVVRGDDEIAAMARAVEIFRGNAIELEELLEERRSAAERLERTVAERTRELEDKRRRLEISDRFKSHFLASASHDLRQPLYALNLFVAELRAGSDPAGRDRLMERIGACVEAMNALFESLLDMARLEAGIIEPHPAAVPVAGCLGHVEATLGDAGRGKGLRLRIVPSRAWVRSDPILLERIMMNLVGNAVRYTERGGVVVGCRRRAGGLRIDVCDTGPGIPAEERDRIFEEYHRLDQRRGGFGLGLAIVDRLARLLGHPIELESRPGCGTRFSVTLPLAAAPADEAEPPPHDAARGRLVVVIDDDALVLEALGGLLSRWGCALVPAPSCAAALDALAAGRRPPDLIVSDYGLADGTSGIEAIARLRAAWGEHVAAFLISGDTAPERLRRARESGFHLLHKPVPPMRLRAMLARLLRPAAAATE